MIDKKKNQELFVNVQLEVELMSARLVRERDRKRYHQRLAELMALFPPGADFKIS